MTEEMALDAGQVRGLSETFADVSIAPLGRNYFERYREVRDAVRAMAEEGAGEGEGGVTPQRLSEHLDPDDLDFMETIHDSLSNFAEEGIRREGAVEPYLSAREDARRLVPFLELLRPHLSM